MSEIHEALWETREAETIASQRLALEKLIVKIANPEKGLFFYLPDNFSRNSLNSDRRPQNEPVSVEHPKPKLYPSGGNSVYSYDFANVRPRDGRKIIRGHDMRVRPGKNPELVGLNVLALIPHEPHRIGLWHMHFDNDVDERFDDPNNLTLRCSSINTPRKYTANGANHIAENFLTQRLNEAVHKMTYHSILVAMGVYERVETR